MSDKIVFIDLETGGLFYYPRMVNGAIRQSNPIIQIACAVVDADTLDIVDTFETKVAFDEAECEAQALVINGYKKENWEKADPKKAAMTKLSAFLKKHATLEKIGKSGKPYRVALLGGANISGFDYPFLRQWYASESEFFPADYHTIENQALAQIYSMITGVKFSSLSQASLSKYFGVAGDGPEHDALVDITVTAKLYRVMIEKLRGLHSSSLGGNGPYPGKVVPCETVVVPTVTMNGDGQVKGVSVKL